MPVPRKMGPHDWYDYYANVDMIENVRSIRRAEANLVAKFKVGDLVRLHKSGNGLLAVVAEVGICILDHKNQLRLAVIDGRMITMSPAFCTKVG